MVRCRMLLQLSGGAILTFDGVVNRILDLLHAANRAMQGSNTEHVWTLQTAVVKTFSGKDVMTQHDWKCQESASNNF